MRNIEVYTDGGYRPLLGVAAYAFGIKIDSKEKYHSGLIKEKELSANKAEFIAFIKAVSFLEKKGILSRRTKNKVTLYTDSMNLKLLYDEYSQFCRPTRINRKIKSISNKYKGILNVVWVQRNTVPEQKFCDTKCNAVFHEYENSLIQSGYKAA